MTNFYFVNSSNSRSHIYTHSSGFTRCLDAAPTRSRQCSEAKRTRDAGQRHCKRAHNKLDCTSISACNAILFLLHVSSSANTITQNRLHRARTIFTSVRTESSTRLNITDPSKRTASYEALSHRGMPTSYAGYSCSRVWLT